ncbi:MAG: SBBP repeat-containing protein [Pleurocapsa sp.]
MNEDFTATTENNGLVALQEVVEEMAVDFLIDESSLTLTDEAEAIFERVGDSELTETEEEVIEEGVSESPINIPEPILDILIAYINDLTVAGTPGSDAFQFGSTGIDIILGREGNDVILAVDPTETFPGQNDIDLLSGGSQSDRFILGDRSKPYYDDGDDSTTGDDSMAMILDFNPNEDVIELHGSPKDYTLVSLAESGEEQSAVAIYLNGETNDELIASVNTTASLSLDADYFKFLDGSAESPTTTKIKQFGTDGIDLSFSVANGNDSSGSTFSTGYTNGTLGDNDFGSLDAFLSKYNNTGSQEWIEQIGTADNDNGYGVDTDAEGNVYWLARTSGELGGDNAGIGNDVVFSKYNSQGEQQWIRQFGSFGNDNPFVDPRVDSAGDVVIAGYTNDDLAAPNADTEIPPSADSWIAKYDSDGNQLWIEQFGTNEGDETFGLDIDSQDNIYTTGWTRGDLGAPNNLNEEGEVTYDIWLAKYDSQGNQQWIEQFGTDDFDWSWDVATDSNDDTYITGWTLGDLAGTNSGSYDIWVAKYDSQGNQQQIQQFGTAGDDAATSVDVDDGGNYYLTGYTDGDLSGAGNAGSYDAWVAKYDSSGNQLWIEQFGSSERDEAYEVSVSDDLVYVTGTTDGSLGSTNTGSFDAWIGKFSAEDGTLLDFDSPSNTALQASGDELAT